MVYWHGPLGVGVELLALVELLLLLLLLEKVLELEGLLGLLNGAVVLVVLLVPDELAELVEVVDPPDEKLLLDAVEVPELLDEAAQVGTDGVTVLTCVEVDVTVL